MDIRRLLTKRIQPWDDRKYDEFIHEAEMCDKMLPKRSTNVSDDEAVKIFRQKLIDYHVNGKPDQLPEYAVHRILFLFDSVNAF